MDPFDLTGPTFLVLYVITAAFCAVVARLVRDELRQPSNKPSDDIELKPYEIAYLQGGDERLTGAVAANLVQRGFLQPGGLNKCLVSIGELPRESDEVERAVFEATRDDSKSSSVYVSGSEIVVDGGATGAFMGAPAYRAA